MIITNPYSLWVPTGNVLIGGSSHAGGDMIQLKTGSTGARNAIRFINDAQSWELGSRGSNNPPNSSFYLYDATAAQFRLYVKPLTGFIGINDIDPSYQLDVSGSIRSTGSIYAAGRIGVGTTTPSAVLEVAGDIKSSAAITTTTTVTQNTMFQGWYNGTTVKAEMQVGASAATVGTTTSHNFGIMTNNTERMTFSTTGNIGIGTSAIADCIVNMGGNIRVSGYMSLEGALRMGGAITKMYYGQHTVGSSTNKSKISTVTHNLDISDTSKYCILLTVYDTSENQDQFALKIVGKSANYFSLKAYRIDGDSWGASFKIDWQMTIFGNTNYITSND
jgi:hypothetical protein